MNIGDVMAKCPDVVEISKREIWVDLSDTEYTCKKDFTEPLKDIETELKERYRGWSFLGGSRDIFRIRFPIHAAEMRERIIKTVTQMEVEIHPRRAELMALMKGHTTSREEKGGSFTNLLAQQIR